ncbi:MAG TPA: GNVR domain-containing protein [Bryobacteraceae bacterium]|nr:GNVR domain-containing protein [Bryobacteraceae bacterium]
MQPTQDVLSVGRRPMDVEDYIDVVRRHKSWIAGPTFASLVIAVVVAFLWPDTYISESTIQVLPPQVPERYVPSNANSEMTHRINQMAATIQSRPNLANLINTHGLYRSELKRKPLEDVIEEMKRNIHISPVTTIQTPTHGRTAISAFKVSFAFSNRHAAQKVTADLARGFIDENIRTLSSQSAATTDFLKDQWEAARKRLDELENKMTEFRLKNAGRLPEQLQANLQTLRSLETQLAGVNDAISRIGQEKLLFENQIRIYQDQLAALKRGGSTLSARAQDERLALVEREVVAMENNLAALRQRYKETHPDVQHAQAQLEMIRKRRDEIVRELAQAKSESAPVVPTQEDLRGTRELEAAIARLQAQIQVKDLELAERTKEQKSLTQAINTYNARIQSSPLMEREYAELSRDYELAKARYEELNTKKSQSEIATALETRHYGERLEVLESASLPETPNKPNRLMIIGAGVGIGLMLGVFLTGAREMKDTSLKNLKDARAYTNLPVLGTIPLLENDLVVRRKRRLVWLAWSTACLVGVIAMSGSIYYYYATRV